MALLVVRSHDEDRVQLFPFQHVAVRRIGPLGSEPARVVGGAFGRQVANAHKVDRRILKRRVYVSEGVAPQPIKPTRGRRSYSKLYLIVSCTIQQPLASPKRLAFPGGVSDHHADRPIPVLTALCTAPVGMRSICPGFRENTSSQLWSHSPSRRRPALRSGMVVRGLLWPA